MLDFEYRAEMLSAKVKHYLITTMGKVLDDADDDECYRAFSYALREEVMINWLASSRTQAEKDVRMLYYLSMEYLPGRILTNTITNLSLTDIINAVFRKLNRNPRSILVREADPALGNGGLGRLASCFLDSLATLHYPARAYGLRYQYGIFEQQIWDGVQIEAPDCWLIGENPWEYRRDLRKVTVKYCGHPEPSTNIHGDEIMTLSNPEEVWALPYDIPIIGYDPKGLFSVVTLRLWTTKESPRNFQLQRYNAGRLDEAAENTTLTDVLYPSDYHETGKRVRLKQEFLLVSASVQDIIRHYLTKHDNFRSFADKVRIQINDTHPSLVIAELIRIFTKKYDIPWKTAVDITVACTGYTNHTILKEALEEWEQHLFYYLLPRQYKIIERLNFDFCNSIRQRFPDDEEKVRRMSIIQDGKIRMANLAVYGSHKVNGVAALHTKILKDKVFQDFYECYPDRFVNVTNGVTPRRWLLDCNPELANFITKRIGPDWASNFEKIANLAEHASDPVSQEEFLQIKKKNKHRFVDYLDQMGMLRNSEGIAAVPPPIVDPNSIFEVQIKRIHEYKRQLMKILHLIMLYHEILETKSHNRLKRTVIFAGKAAASYDTAKEIIRFIHAVARKVNRDPDVSGILKIVFIENYNISKAEIIIPAADLSLQISTAGTEASGTGNMKLAMNGALTVGTRDGANIEMEDAVGKNWWPFSFGCTSEEIFLMQKNNNYQPRDIYEHDMRIKRAVDTLRDRTFAMNDAEHIAFSDLYHKLIEMHYGGTPDRYFTLKDLGSLYEIEKKVETLYANPENWAEYAIHNIAGMGYFSTDRSIREYSDKIWNLVPCPPDAAILERIRHEYSLADQCRIF